MKISCGTDIIEIERIKKSICDMGTKFVDKVFSVEEMTYCESKNEQKYQHYAARFAAKEAAFKALSGSIDDKYSISWKDIEVENDKNGRPKLVLNPQKIDQNIIENIDLSISHCKEYACANVVVLYK